LQAKASVSQAKAQLDLAKIDLDYTEVKAYIDGEIGKTKVTVGNFVNASAAPLAKVVQMDPIRVAFSLTDKEFLAIQAMEEQNISDFEINIELANGEVMKQKLEKIFASNEVNMGTATIAVYADVRNEKKLLRPGSYVHVFITSSKPQKGMIVPETAIIQSGGNSLVFVVDDENIAKMRPVQLGESYDGKQVIKFGLRVGEKIMTSGLSNRMLRDGAQINIISAQ
jgi:membrane fusion protein (multidrug efflux system)